MTPLYQETSTIMNIAALFITAKINGSNANVRSRRTGK